MKKCWRHSVFIHKFVDSWPQVGSALVTVEMLDDVTVQQVTLLHELEEVVLNGCENLGIVIETPQEPQSEQNGFLVNQLRLEATHVAIGDVAQTRNVEHNLRTVHKVRNFEVNRLEKHV